MPLVDKNYTSFTEILARIGKSKLGKVESVMVQMDFMLDAAAAMLLNIDLLGAIMTTYM
jgi:hypothetical protein